MITQIKQSIYQILSQKLDPIGVYEYVPQFAEYPYVHLTSTQYRDYSTSSTKGICATSIINIYGKDMSAVMLQNIAENIKNLLEENGPSFCNRINFLTGSILQKKDLTTTITLQFNIYKYKEIL